MAFEDLLGGYGALAAGRDDTVIRVGCVLMRMALYCPADGFMPLANPVRDGRAVAVRRRS
jgi:hypothetical protein